MKNNYRNSKNNKKPIKYTVTENCTVEDFFAKQMSGKSRTSLKQLLLKGVFVANGRALRRLDEALTAGTVVEQQRKPEPQFKMPDGLHIVYEDRWYVVVDKAAGLLTIATDKEAQRTAYAYISEYLKFYNPNDKVFIVHRLDRETSGLLIFAKSEEAQEAMQDDWANTVEDRKYVAVVEGYPEADDGTIHTWLREHPKSLKMSVCAEGEGQEAITHYHVEGRKQGYALLTLQLETGRKNQIRVHLKHIGHPIAGDAKYGAQSNPIRRLCLHAYKIEFMHPFLHKKINLETHLPQQFIDIFR